MTFFKKLINLFIFGCVGSSFLCEGFLQLRRAGATLHRGARASHCRGLCCCGAQAPDTQDQQSWLTGLAAPRHVGSSRTRARTHVPCIGRQILNHCATREDPKLIFIGVQLIYNVMLASVQQSESVIRIYISILFQILFPYTSLQRIEQGSLCYSVGSYQLSILYTVVHFGGKFSQSGGEGGQSLSLEC